MFKNDLQYRSYESTVEPSSSMTKTPKGRSLPVDYIQFPKRRHDVHPLSPEMMFAIDDEYTSQNDRVWTVDRFENDEKSGIEQERKFPQNAMVLFLARFEGVTPQVILKKGSVDHERIHEGSASGGSQKRQGGIRRRLDFQRS